VAEPSRHSMDHRIRRPFRGLSAALARTFPPSIDRVGLPCLSPKQLQENSFFSYQAALPMLNRPSSKRLEGLMPKSNRGLVSPVLRKAFFGLGLFLPFLAVALIVAFSGGSLAQSLPGNSPDLLNQLRQQFGQQGGGTGGTTDLTGSGQGYQNTIIQSAPVQNGPPLPPSRLEQIMST